MSSNPLASANSKESAFSCFNPLPLDHGELASEMQDHNEQVVISDDREGVSNNSIQNRYMESFEDMEV